MTELNDIYSSRLLDLAADIPHAAPLEAPDGEATAHSKLCGSTVSVQLKLDGDTITGFSQTVKACLLGQASASIVGREIIGAKADEVRRVGVIMRKMLKEGGPPPEGRWAELALLEPVRPYKSRHASTLLIFDAIDKALSEAQSKQAEAASASA